MIFLKFFSERAKTKCHRAAAKEEKAVIRRKKTAAMDYIAKVRYYNSIRIIYSAASVREEIFVLLVQNFIGSSKNFRTFADGNSQL